MKKLVSILLTLALAVSLMMAVPVGADPGTVVLGNDIAVASKALGTTDAKFIGSGCWEADLGKEMELYIVPTIVPFSSLGTFTIDEIESISYRTNKPGGTPDFYLAIYTEPDDVDDTTGWYGYRLNAEPYLSINLNAPVDQWNQWNTDAVTNQLTFFDEVKIHSLGFYGQPTLQELQASTINWRDYNAAYDDQAIDYGAETVKYITFQTGTGWMDTFVGYIDEIIINLTTGKSLTIDLEKDNTSVNLGVNVPDVVAISVSPTVIDFGTLVPGQTSDVFDITVENIGTHKVDVDADVSGSVLFRGNLELKNYTTGVPDWKTRAWPTIVDDLAMGSSEVLRTKLPVPSGYTPKGVETGTLVFIARPA